MPDRHTPIGGQVAERESEVPVQGQFLRHALSALRVREDLLDILPEEVEDLAPPEDFLVGGAPSLDQAFERRLGMRNEASARALERLARDTGVTRSDCEDESPAPIHPLEGAGQRGR